MKAKRKWWLVIVTAALTVVLVIIAMNFRAEQNLRYEVEHHYAVADPQFRREMALLGRGIVSGNDITPLQNGDEILPAMLSAIRGAERTITFETYIYWSGDVGQQFTDALAERAAAGVDVHLIIDWVGSSKMDPTMLEPMEAAGVRLQRYRPLQWYTLDRLNNRTHRKLLVIDGRVGFTGGAGVADVWKGDAQSPDHWRMHFRVEGPVVGHLQAAFNENWIRTAGEVLDGEAYFPPLPTVVRATTLEQER